MLRNTRRVQPRSCCAVCRHLTKGFDQRINNSRCVAFLFGVGGLLHRSTKHKEKFSAGHFITDIPRAAPSKHHSCSGKTSNVRSHFMLLNSDGLSQTTYRVRACVSRMEKTTALALFLSLSFSHVHRFECALLNRRCTDVPTHNQLSPITRARPFFPSVRALRRFLSRSLGSTSCQTLYASALATPRFFFFSALLLPRAHNASVRKCQTSAEVNVGTSR